jgi:Flp pilus assembly protein TadB
LTHNREVERLLRRGNRSIVLGDDQGVGSVQLREEAMPKLAERIRAGSRAHGRLKAVECAADRGYRGARSSGFSTWGYAMSENKSDKNRAAVDQGARRTILSLYRVHVVIAAVIFAAFVVLGIVIQDWAIVAIFAVLCVAAAVTSRLFARRD